MDELNLDNLLNEEEIATLFTDDSNEDTSTEETNVEESTETNVENKTDDTAEKIDTNTLFSDDSESVGSEENNIEEKEDTTSDKNGSSPKNNFYSSIAKALKEDGVFPDLDDEEVASIKEAEDLASSIESQIQARLDEKQKRIDDALNSGVEPSVIKSYESTISYLDSITEEMLKEESEQGENLRKQLIFRDFLNRGYTEEEAREDLQEILDNGSDVKKATRALANNKEFFRNGYNKIIEDAQEEAKNAEKERKAQAEQLRKSILEDNKVFGEITLDKSTRQKVFDNISKPVYKDKETGELFTALQKYEMDNKTEFLKNVGLIFTLTDGFKSLDKLVKGKVNKEVKKGLRELEHTLNNTTRTSDGNIRFVTGVGDDSNSYLGHFDLDID